MATNASINVRVGNKFHSILLNYDGYPEHTLKVLKNHYNSQEQAEKLVSLGDLSTLRASCEKPKGHSYDNQIEGYCVYYDRDRGESEAEMQVSSEINKDNDYSYLWNGKDWINVEET